LPHLILVRHSQPEIAPELPARQWHLSAEGRRRCQILAPRLAHFQVRRVFSSSEPKAAETAHIVAAHLGVPDETIEGLHEHDRRNVMPWSTQEQFENSVRALFEQPDQLVWGVETADQAYERFAQAVASVITRSPNQDVVIVAHGTVITLLVSRTNTIEPFPFWKRLGLPALVIMSLPKMAVVAVGESIGESMTPHPEK